MDLSQSGFVIEKDLSLSTVISQTLATLKKSPFFFFGLPLITALPYSWGLFIKPYQLMIRPQYLIIMGVLSIFLSLIGQGAVSYGVFQSLKGEEVTGAASLWRGLSRLPTLFFIIIILALVGLVFVVLIFMGFYQVGFSGATVVIYSLIIFGLALLVVLRLAVTFQCCVVEKAGALKSLNRSTELTEGNRLQILALVLLVGGLDLAVTKGGTAIIGALIKTMGPSMFVGALLGVFTTGLSWVMMSILYFELRRIKEDLDLDSLAKIFD